MNGSRTASESPSIADLSRCERCTSSRRIVTSGWKDKEGNDGNLYNLNIEHSCGWAVPAGFAKYDSEAAAQMTDLDDLKASA